MITSGESAAFERGIDSMLQLVLPDKAEQVAAFQGDRELRARIEELAAKSTEGELNATERAEYAGYIRANKFVAILQRRAPVADSLHVSISTAIKALVRTRAGNRCEYCQLHQDDSPLAALHVEHVIPKKHGGSDDDDNLALACIDYNLHKGPNLTGLDPESDCLTLLFNPRIQSWREHFAWSDIWIVGPTWVAPPPWC